MSTWMSDLPSQIVQKVPINQLAIPGSHDAGAFYLDRKSPICPDEPSAIKALGKYFKNIVIEWSLTQCYPIKQQLILGVRYFDMRTGYLNSKNDFFFVHGCYGFQMFSLLQVIADFCEIYPKEVVIVDFQEFHEFTPKLHEIFADNVVKIFKGKLYSYVVGNGASSTLQEIWATGKQIIVRYNNDFSPQSYPEFWASNTLYSPWRNTSSTSKLIKFLDERLNEYSAKQLSVFQAILTPQTNDILKGLLCCCCSPHKLSKLDEKLKTPITNWLDKVYTSKMKGVNIFMCDFIANDGCVQCILQLNHLYDLN
ncbi:PI-PLC X domain-containing protein 2 isoform X1 [Hydra vulgaris]|uniref:PI-PLC X domain-containing protein 2 isoform X1 n=1 Tax=Hydra vulgaris TaxID=6087 RepID=A0ABM4B528_HYDVU